MKAESLEVTLTKALSLAARWKAVILIDEADVFMEERGHNEIQRNELVSGK